jgi:hypothetical protein
VKAVRPATCPTPNLVEQLKRAKRFAASMTNDTERNRFNAMAAEFQRELDRSLEAEKQTRTRLNQA